MFFDYICMFWGISAFAKEKNIQRTFFVFAPSVIKSVFFCIIHWLHKHDRPGPVTSTAMSIQASRGVRKHPFGKAFDISQK